MARTLSTQAAYAASLCMLFSLLTQSNQALAAWYYHETLTIPADSRAILRTYQHPEFCLKNLAKQPALKQWVWLKKQPMQNTLPLTHEPYLAPKTQQGRALPFWPDLKAKSH